MSQLEKLIGNIFIGNKLSYLESFNYSKDTVREEKREALKKINQRRKVTESQFSEHKKFIDKLEMLAIKLNNTFQTNVNRYNIFKNVPHMMIVYDHKFKVLDYNDAFIEHFCIDATECDSTIFNTLDEIEKVDIVSNKIMVYGKLIEYDCEYKCQLKNEDFIVTTTPIYDNMERFDFFVRIYTKI